MPRGIRRRNYIHSMELIVLYLQIHLFTHTIRVKYYDFNKFIMQWKSI